MERKYQPPEPENDVKVEGHCNDISPVYFTGTWYCDRPAGHDWYHSSQKGGWVWRDAPKRCRGRSVRG